MVTVSVAMTDRHRAAAAGRQGGEERRAYNLVCENEPNWQMAKIFDCGAGRQAAGGLRGETLSFGRTLIFMDSVQCTYCGEDSFPKSAGSKSSMSDFLFWRFCD